MYSTNLCSVMIDTLNNYFAVTGDLLRQLIYIVPISSAFAMQMTDLAQKRMQESLKGTFSTAKYVLQCPNTFLNIC